MANFSMANFSMGNLMAGFVFGIFGWYIFKAGRNEANAKRVVLGIVLLAYGYFIPNAWVNWGVGSALVFFNYYSRWMG